MPKGTDQILDLTRRREAAELSFQLSDLETEQVEVDALQGRISKLGVAQA